MGACTTVHMALASQLVPQVALDLALHALVSQPQFRCTVPKHRLSDTIKSANACKVVACARGRHVLSAHHGSEGGLALGCKVSGQGSVWWLRHLRGVML